jgi:hypothetical protein
LIYLITDSKLRLVEKTEEGRVRAKSVIQFTIELQTRVGAHIESRVVPKMADIPVTGYQAFRTDKRKTLKWEYQQLIGLSPDADAQLKQLYEVLCEIKDVAGYTLASVGESELWPSIVSAAEYNRQNFCKALIEKTMFSALYGTYTVTLQELKAVLKASTPAGQSKTPKSAATEEYGSKNVRRTKRHSTNETAPTSKKAATTAASTALDTPHKVTTRNFLPHPQGNEYGHRFLRCPGHYT